MKPASSLSNDAGSCERVPVYQKSQPDPPKDKQIDCYCLFCIAARLEIEAQTIRLEHILSGH